MNKPIYKLLDWIDESKLNWYHLFTNPKAVKLLEANQYKINQDYLSLNPNAIELLEANTYKNKWGLFIRKSEYIYIRL